MNWNVFHCCLSGNLASAPVCDVEIGSIVSILEEGATVVDGYDIAFRCLYVEPLRCICSVGHDYCVHSGHTNYADKPLYDSWATHISLMVREGGDTVTTLSYGGGC